MGSRATSSRLTLLMLCLASGGWGFGFGLGAPLASLWLRDAGSSAQIIGLNTSLYYLGVAVAAFATPYLMRRASRLCVVGGIVVDAVVIALFPWTNALSAWFALRLLGGMATALSIIPMETLVNYNAPPEHRGRDFGFYAFSVALGVALGSLVGLPLYPLAPRLAFALGGLVTLAAGLVAWIGWPASPAFQPDEAAQVRLASRTYESNTLCYGTAWLQGFLEGGLITFLSIYLLGLGYTVGGTSLLAGCLFAGVILCQLPLAWLADRLGQFHVLLGCHGLLITALLLVRWGPETPLLVLALILLGACCGALYPLGLALLGERVPLAGLPQANAWYLASNCAGSLCGPVLFGWTIDWFGQPAQFLAGTAATAVIVGLGIAMSKGTPARNKPRTAAAEPTQRQAA